MKRILKFLGIGIVACLVLSVIGAFINRGSTPAAPATNSAAAAPTAKIQVTLVSASAAAVATEAPVAAAAVATEPAPAAEPTAVPAAPAATEAFLGDVIEANGISLAALSVQDPAPAGMLYKAKDGKKLVAVEVIVGNLSDDKINVNPLNASLIDEGGFAYQTELAGVDDQIASLFLDKGERARGWIAFEVPADAKPAGIKYKPSLFGGDVVQAPLTAPPAGHTAIQPSAAHTPPQLVKLGEATEANGISLSAVQVNDPAPAGVLYKAKDGTRLVSVEVVLGNTSAEKVGSNALYFFLVDSNGFVYAAELAGTDSQIDTIDLAKGEKVKGLIAFTVPAGAVVESIKYGPLFEPTVVQVGLA